MQELLCIMIMTHDKNMQIQSNSDDPNTYNTGIYVHVFVKRTRAIVRVAGPSAVLP